MVDFTYERWLPVEGWEGLYEVSDLGRVRSLDRIVRRGRTGQYVKPGTMLAQWRDRQGYWSVTLSRVGKKARPKVHRLVGDAFLGPLPEGQETRHGPEGKDWNHVANLSYGTRLDNAADKFRDGTQQRGACVGGARLTEEIVLACRQRYAAGGVRYQDLMREYGISLGAVSGLISGRTWAHVPMPQMDVDAICRANRSATAKALAATPEGAAKLANARHAQKGKPWSPARRAAQRRDQ